MPDRLSVRIFALGEEERRRLLDAEQDLGGGHRALFWVRDVRGRPGEQEIRDAHAAGSGTAVPAARSGRPEEGGGRAVEGGAGAAGGDPEAEGAGGRTGEAARPDREGGAGPARRPGSDAARASGGITTAAAGAPDPALREPADEQPAPAEPGLDAGADRERHRRAGGQRSGADPHAGQGSAAAPDHRFDGGDAERPDGVGGAAAARVRLARQLSDGRRPAEGAEDRRYFEELELDAGAAAAEVSSSLITAPPFITKGTRGGEEQRGEDHALKTSSSSTLPRDPAFELMKRGARTMRCSNPR